jgi:hypothetical protein
MVRQVCKTADVPSPHVPVEGPVGEPVPGTEFGAAVFAPTVISLGLEDLVIYWADHICGFRRWSCGIPDIS